MKQEGSYRELLEGYEVQIQKDCPNVIIGVYSKDRDLGLGRFKLVKSGPGLYSGGFTDTKGNKGQMRLQFNKSGFTADYSKNQEDHVFTKKWNAIKL